MMIATTQNIFLETLSLSTRDIGFIYTLYNTCEFKKNIGDKGLTDTDKTKDYIKTGPLSMYQDCGYGLWKMRLRSIGESIGVCGLLKRDWLEYPDLGFALLPAFEGKGYAFEAAYATLAWAKENIAEEKILAITGQKNARSISLLNRLGFEFLDIVKAPESKDVLGCYCYRLR